MMTNKYEIDDNVCIPIELLVLPKKELERRIAELEAEIKKNKSDAEPFSDN